MGLLSWLRRDRYRELQDEIEKLRNEVKSEILELKMITREAKLKAEAASVKADTAASKVDDIDQELASVMEKINRVLNLSKIGLEAKKEIAELTQVVESLAQKIATPGKSSREKARKAAEIKPGPSTDFDILNGLSRSERAIINVLMSSDMPLGYEDIARVLGKSESTIRDHITQIRKKSDIIEVVEGIDRKKMFRIPLKLKNRILG